VRLVFRLRELFRRRNIDIIHTRNWGAFDGVLAACTMPRPALIHGEHGRDIADPAGLNRRRNFIRRALAFRTRKLVAVSQDLYSWLRQTVRVPESKLVCIPNGVDTDRFLPGRNYTLRRRWGIADDEFVIGAVGRLDPIKNYEGLLMAVRSLQANGHKVRLVIAGDGPDRDKIYKLLRFPFDPTPLLLGVRSDVDQIYQCFDLFALNSFAEGMSNTLLEAMASGLPTVCTAVGGNAELVADGERGRLVRSGDHAELTAAIAGYISSPHARAVHGAQAREFIAQHFSLKQMIQRYVGLYESIA